MSKGFKWFGLAASLFAILVIASLLAEGATWEGVDTTVVERFALELGSTPRAPLLNVEGDLLLFVFTLAGASGGFLLGYCWRMMFEPGHEGESSVGGSQEHR